METVVPLLLAGMVCQSHRKAKNIFLRLAAILLWIRKVSVWGSSQYYYSAEDSGYIYPSTCCLYIPIRIICLIPTQSEKVIFVEADWNAPQEFRTRWHHYAGDPQHYFSVTSESGTTAHILIPMLRYTDGDGWEPISRWNLIKRYIMDRCSQVQKLVKLCILNGTALCTERTHIILIVSEDLNILIEPSILPV